MDTKPLDDQDKFTDETASAYDQANANRHMPYCCPEHGCGAWMSGHDAQSLVPTFQCRLGHSYTLHARVSKRKSRNEKHNGRY
jgi:hypothetical protein